MKDKNLSSGISTLVYYVNLSGTEHFLYRNYLFIVCCPDDIALAADTSYWIDIWDKEENLSTYHHSLSSYWLPVLAIVQRI